MTRFRELLLRLQSVGLDFIVVGGVAATLHGVQEPTRDLDVCIRPDRESWARVVRFLEGLHPRYALTPDKRPFIPQLDELATFKNLYVLTDLGRVDFLGEVEPLGPLSRLLERAEPIELEGQLFRIISLDDLLTVKEHVRRPKDLEVAAELRAIRDAKGR